MNVGQDRTYYLVEVFLPLDIAVESGSVSLRVRQCFFACIYVVIALDLNCAGS